MVNHEDNIIFQNDEQVPTREDDIFCTEEVRIEEMAIDGICGVY
jgi:mycofactocin precursor